MPTPDVRVRLSAEGVTEVVNALKKVQSEAAATAAKSKGSFQGLNTVLAGTKALLASIGSILAAGAILNLIKQGAQAADEMGKLAQKTGTTVKNISALAFAAKTADVETGQLQQSLGLLSKQLVELEKGTPATVNAFRALGLSSKDFAGKDTAEAFGLIAERMGRLKDSTAKTAISLQIFGRSGAQLIPLLNDLSENGLQGAIDAGTRLGVVFDDEIAAKAQRLNDDLTTLKQQTVAAAAQFVGGFAPAVSRSLESTSDRLGPYVSKFEKAADIISRALTAAFFLPVTMTDMLVSNIREGINVIATLGRVAQDVAKLNFDAAKADIEKGAEEAKRIAQEFLDRLKERGLGVQGAFSGARLGHGEAFKPRGGADLDIDAPAKGMEKTEKAARGVRNAMEATDLIIEENTLGTEELAKATDEWLAGIKAADQAALDALEAQAQAAQQVRDAFRSVATSGLADFFVNGTSAANTFLASLRRLTAEMLAQRIIAQASGFFGGGAGGAGIIAPDFGNAASGGLIAGPGTGTSDSIRGRLSANEYVVRAAAVRQPGVLSMLHGLNYGKRGYADGGLVEGGGSTSLSSNLTIGLDSGLVLRTLQSQEGQRVIVKALGNNRRAVRRVAG